MSPSISKMVSTFKMLDSFKTLWPKDTTTKSHYYTHPWPGGTRIDRVYHHGLSVASSGYVPVGGLSDHCAIVTAYDLPQDFHKAFLPKSIPYYKMKEEVMLDVVFQKGWRGASDLGGWLGKEQMCWILGTLSSSLGYES